jgi:hypothetical protein
MFKEVEALCLEYKKVAQVYKDKLDRFHDLEGKEYAIQDEIEEIKLELEDKYRKDIEPKVIADEQRCKHCESVVTPSVVDRSELAKLEKKMFDKIDTHPNVKRKEVKAKKAEEEYQALDKEIDEMADTIYEYENKIKKALEAIELPDSWFNFHTSLV